MPMCYSLSLATAGNTTTNGSANTESEVLFIKPGSTRSVAVYAMDVIGKGAALTTLSGIGFRFIRWGTASTAGTSITPSPKDPGMQAAVCTAASAPTAGTTRTNRMIFGCGATGPGGWFAKNQEAMEILPASNAASFDLLSVSGTTSLDYEWSAEIWEM